MVDHCITVLWDLILHDIGSGTYGNQAAISVDRTNRHATAAIGATVQQRAAVALLNSIESKFQDEIDKEAADSAAWDVFHVANEACRTWALNEKELGPYDEVVLGEFAQIVYDFFNPGGMPLLNEVDIIPYLDFGPGSAPGAFESDFVSKIGESQLSATSDLLVSLYYEWVKDSPARLDCEIARVLRMGPPIVMDSSKITAVPKKRQISRLVKPEPLLNMFFQKGVAGVLKARLRQYFGIDLSTQPSVNSELARLGSTQSQFATIDLKSASDYISYSLCKKYIPRSSFLWLDITRSSYAESDKGKVALHMMATMGNDYCFPLQTIFFSCAVHAVYKALGLPIRKGGRNLVLSRDVESGEVNFLRTERTPPNWGVFGDDIVVLDEAYAPLIRLLKALGSIPNMDKSFNRASGNFRESCGSDWIDGFNVRGVYCKSLRTIQDRYALINNLVDWSVRTGILLPESIGYLRSSVPEVAVPPWENPDSGIRMPESCLVEEHRVFKCYKTHKELDLQGSYLYKRYLPSPKHRRLDNLYEDDDGQDQRTDRVPTEGCYWNSSAVFLGAIKGHCRGGSVSLRQWETSYRKRLGVAPCWDYIQPGDPRYEGRQLWFAVAAAYFNGRS